MEISQITKSSRKVTMLPIRSRSVVTAMLAVGAIAIMSSNAVAHSHHHRGGMSGQTTDQSTAIVDARIAQFKTALRLTPDQEKNWGPVENAMNEMAKNRNERMGKLRDEKAEAVKSAASRSTPAKGGVVASDHGWNAMDDLRARAEERAANGADIRNFLDASTPLYGSLDAVQQRKFGALAREFVHREMDSDSRI